jgi:hypothetical protein
LKYTISINANTPTGNANLNVNVDAPDMIAALEAAKAELVTTLAAAQLIVRPVTTVDTTAPQL